MPKLIEDVLAIRGPEAARRLGVARGAVDNAIKRGDLRSVKFGGCVLIPVIELERIWE